MISDTNPTPSPATEEVTVGDVYRAIDWSCCEKVLNTFAQKHYPGKEKSPNEDFTFKFRCAIIETALIGKPKKHRDSAIHLLKMSGAWPQVVSFCQTKGLMK